MQKKILIALDGSPSSDHAVDYVGLMEGAIIKDLWVTLFFVMKPVPPFLRREGRSDPALFRQLQTLEAKNRAEARRVLDRQVQRLEGHGLSPERIEAKAQPWASGVARDILFEAEQGLYDAVVLGRRGLSKAQELFVGSVTNKVVQHAERLPVWIVGGRVKSHKVLCAVDGSEGSLKAVDHMAFMLGGNPDCEITLFHVGASLANYCPLEFEGEVKEEIEGELMTSDSQCMDDFYSRALKVLAEGGISPEQVTTRTREGVISVPRAILEEMRRGGYGTVVLGRRGENRSFFLGHVSDKVVAKGEGAAVWVVG